MNWEPWTGCYPISDGCANCYFYGPYAKRHGQNTILKTDKFDWPIRRNKKGEYNIKGDKILATCFATDFFLPEADEWRKEAYPMKRRFIACAPLLEAIDLTPYLNGVDHVTVGGETGRAARECDYEWVSNIREQCVRSGVTFWFKNTGSLFRHDGIVERINPYQQTGRAKELGIDISDGKRLF